MARGGRQWDEGRPTDSYEVFGLLSVGIGVLVCSGSGLGVSDPIGSAFIRVLMGLPGPFAPPPVAHDEAVLVGAVAQEVGEGGRGGLLGLQIGVLKRVGTGQ